METGDVTSADGADFTPPVDTSTDDAPVTAADKKDIDTATDTVPPGAVATSATSLVGSDPGDGFDGTGTKVQPPNPAAAGVGPVDQAIKGAQIDATSNRMTGAPADAPAPPGDPRTVSHFANEDAARGIIRNGLRTGDSGLAFTTTKPKADGAGADAKNADLRLDLEVRGPANGTVAPAQWRQMGDDAAAALKSEGVENPTQGQIEARRNQILQSQIRESGNDVTDVKLGRGQAFDVRTPNGLAGSTVTGISGGPNASALAADRQVGSLVAKEVLSGNATSAAKAAEAAGMTPQLVEAASKAATVAKYAGRVLVPVGVAADAYQTVTSDDPVRTGISKASAWGGAFAGAKAGLLAGGGIGAFGGPVGAAVGGVAGAIGGGIAGYMGGEWAGGKIVDGIRSWFR
jgi:hypothetical protein